MDAISQTTHAQWLLNYTFKGNWVYALIISALYIAEIVMMILKYLDRYESFRNRPTYEVIQISKTSGLIKTVSKKNSLKDCGDYGDNADDVKDFVNDFPDWISVIFFAYIIFATFSALVDVFKRFLFLVRKPKVYNSSKDRDDGLLKRDPGSTNGESAIWVSLMLIVFFYIPLFKSASLGLTYPYISARYEKCIDMGQTFMMNTSFYTVMWIGFTLSNGLIWLMMFSILPVNDRKTKYLKIFVLVVNLPGIAGAILWFCVLICSNDKIFGACFIILAIFIIFTLFVIPFISADILKTSVISFSVIIRFLLVKFCEHI
jgi:hypothetical protein